MSTNTHNLTLCFARASCPTLNPQKPIIVRSPVPRINAPNQVLIQVNRFGWSANNITYQVLGEHPHFRYFDFHAAPASDGTSPEAVSPRTHGLVPVWGFGTIVESSHPKISAGERVYGYFAPTRYLLLPVSPSDVNRHSFYVPRPHLPADRRPYNQIIRCAFDPQYDPSPFAEDMTMLYRPLFWTAFWCEDWIASSNYRNGATTVLISSASSKTAFCLAYRIQKRIAVGDISSKTKVIGITSRSNVAFTAKLNLYHEIVDYDSFATSSGLLSRKGNKDLIYVDVAGNDKLNKQLFEFLSRQDPERPAAMISLGFSNLTPGSGGVSDLDWKKECFDATSPLTSWKMENFFMPEWLDIRKHQLSLQEIFARQLSAWKGVMKDGKEWVHISRIHCGSIEAESLRVAKDGFAPDQGMIWSLWDQADETSQRQARL